MGFCALPHLTLIIFLVPNEEITQGKSRSRWSAWIELFFYFHLSGEALRVLAVKAICSVVNLVFSVCQALQTCFGSPSESVPVQTMFSFLLLTRFSIRLRSSTNDH